MVRALFPGTFDPIHYGHIDIATRAARLFDEVLMAVYDLPLKTLMFDPKERIALVREAFSGNATVKVMGYSGLTIDFARKMQAQVIVRGLRVFSDFEFEFRMALITAEEHTFLSSTTVREIATLGGDVSSMVPPFVDKALRAKVTSLGDQHFPPNALRD
jgi:pantetheine-phosphate adenylyltransferase